MSNTSKMQKRMKVICNAMKNGTSVDHKKDIDFFTIQDVRKSHRRATGKYKIFFDLIAKTISYTLDSGWGHQTALEVQYIPSANALIINKFNATTDMEDIGTFQQCLKDYLGDLMYPHPIEDYISDPDWEGCKIESITDISLHGAVVIKYKGQWYRKHSTYADGSTHSKVLAAFYKTHTHVHWCKASSDLYNFIDQLTYRKHYKPELVQEVTEYIEKNYTKPSYWDEKVIKPTIPQPKTKYSYDPNNLNAEKVLKHLVKLKKVTKREDFYLFYLYIGSRPDNLKYEHYTLTNCDLHAIKEIVRTDPEYKYALCKRVRLKGEDTDGNPIDIVQWKAYEKKNVTCRWEPLDETIKTNPTFNQLQFMDFERIDAK